MKFRPSPCNPRSFHSERKESGERRFILFEDFKSSEDSI